MCCVSTDHISTPLRVGRLDRGRDRRGAYAGRARLGPVTLEARRRQPSAAPCAS